MILSILPAVLSQQVTKFLEPNGNELLCSCTEMASFSVASRRAKTSIPSKQTLTQNQTEKKHTHTNTSTNSCLLLFALANIDPKLNGIWIIETSYDPNKWPSILIKLIELQHQRCTNMMLLIIQFGMMKLIMRMFCDNDVLKLFNKLRCSCTRQFLEMQINTLS